MKKYLITILQYIFFFGLGFWIIYNMLHELTPKDSDELITSLKNVQYWYLVPVILIGFLSHFFRALRWQLLLHTIDVNPSVINTCFAVFIGYIVNLGIPRAGEVAKCTVLAKYDKVPPHKIVGTILAERAFDIFCLIILWTLAFSLQASIINNYVIDFIHKFKAFLVAHENIFLLLIIGLVVVVLSLIIIYRRHKENKIGKFIKEMGHGFFSILRMKKRWEFIGYTVLMWLMYAFQIYVGFQGIPGLKAYHLPFASALVVLVYGSVGIIITPGGIGAYTALVYSILVIYGVDQINAQTFGWISWAAQTVIVLIFGMLSLILIHPYNNRRNGKTKVDTIANT